jgi:DNA-binding CsgD family transcriptional regulator
MGASAAADYGKALLRAGYRVDGVARLERAWRTYDAIGSVGAAAGVQRQLSLVGVRRRRQRTAGDRPVTGWGALTATEAKVARLVADGHTNRSAAHALGISVNTVGTHLNSVFAKLAVRSRLQLSHSVRDAGPDRPKAPNG